MSSSAYSSRSKDFTTAGSRCWPALVRVSACGRRSTSGTPVRRSSAMTCRDRALWEINKAFAAAVKLPCLATPSKARSAFSGSQRRSMLLLCMATLPKRARPRGLVHRHTHPECSVAPRDPSFQCLFSMRVDNFSALRCCATMKVCSLDRPVPSMSARPLKSLPALSGHKIAAVSISHHRLPLAPAFNASWDTKPRLHFDATIVRVSTDTGLVGVGSGDRMLGFEGHESLFIGHDPLSLERHYRVLSNIDFHYGRCWPLDLALWDLAGKITGQPCWKRCGRAWAGSSSCWWTATRGGACRGTPKPPGASRMHSPWRASWSG